MKAPIVHIVDDDGCIRTAVANLVRSKGYHAQTYASADEFRAVFPGGEPGCIVLDVEMPGMNGLALQAWMLQQDDPLPIIFVSGHAAIHDFRTAVERGAVAFLTKPIDGVTLLDAVARALARQMADTDPRTLQQ